jgi:hypothetical protein
MKTCTVCGIEKELSEFYNHHKDGKFKHCKQCHNAKNRSWKLANPEAVKRHKGKINSASYQKKHRDQTKDGVFIAYGGYKCACCGETEPMFLSIDHIANNGAEERRRVQNKDFYRYLRNNGYPTGYQVLCMNCNHGKHRNGGTCPHQSSRFNDYPSEE